MNPKIFLLTYFRIPFYPIYRAITLNPNKPPRRKQRGIRCHAGLDPASSLDFWIPAFAGMTIRCKWVGYENKQFRLR
jgi:hypothetical protein